MGCVGGSATTLVVERFDVDIGLGCADRGWIGDVCYLKMGKCRFDA